MDAKDSKSFTVLQLAEQHKSPSVPFLKSKIGKVYKKPMLKSSATRVSIKPTLKIVPIKESLLARVVLEERRFNNAYQEDIDLNTR